MTTLDDLLRAILADPADDGARLAYADRCEEEGQTERAEFIRMQCALVDATFWPPLSAGSLDAMQRRERELLLRYGFDWLPKIGIKPMLHDGGDAEGVNFKICTGTEKGSGIQCDFRRGFVESVTCSCTDWLAHGPAVVAAQPVTAVRLADREPDHVGNDLYPYFRWLASGERWREAEEFIPGKLYTYMPRGERNRLQWATRQAAHAALSAACVRWARAAAGLPPLAG